MFCGSHSLMGAVNQEHCLGNQIALEILSRDNKSHCGIATSVVLGECVLEQCLLSHQENTGNHSCHWKRD